jgi:hypothetical protein
MIFAILNRIAPNHSEPQPSHEIASPTSTEEKQSRKKRSAEFAAEKARIKQLEKHFVITTDEFDGIKTYRHRVFSKFMNGNGTTIEAEIHENGNARRIFVESEYVSNDWIFHDSIQVQAKGIVPVASSGKTQHEVINGGGVCEVTRPSVEQSILIANAIKAASDSHQPVRVRLSGRFDKDFTLRAAHEQAIAETYELYSLLASPSQ